MMDFIMKMGCGIHIPSCERETVARFDDIFDLCSLVRLRFICQIWHIFTSIWAMYPISLGYKLIFDSPQSDWLPIRWIYSNSPSSLSPSSIFAQQFYQLFSFKTFAPSSQSHKLTWASSSPSEVSNQTELVHAVWVYTRPSTAVQRRLALGGTQ